MQLMFQWRLIGSMFAKLKGLFIPTVFLIIALLVMWPLISQIQTSTTSDNDGPLIAWIIEQNKLSFLSLGSKNIYNLPFFYPYTKTLAYSEPMLTMGAMAALFSHFHFSPITQLNIILLLSVYLCLLFTYLWAKEILHNRWLAILAASFLTFSVLHFQFIVHAHSYLIYGIPLALYAWQKYVTDKKIRYLFLGILAFLIQAMNNPASAYLTGFALMATLLEKNNRRIFVTDRKIWLLILLTVIICCLIYLPYIQVAREFGLPFNIRDAAHFSFSLNYLFSADILVPIFLLLLLFKLSLKKLMRFLYSQKVWTLITFIGLLFMLGPVAKWSGQTIKIFHLPIPLPYAVVYYLIPGLTAIRAVTQFVILAALGFSILLAQAFKQSTLKQLYKLGLLLVFIFWLLYLAHKNLPIFPIAVKAPAIYEVIKSRSEKTMAVFPMYVWTMLFYAGYEDERLLYQLDHNKTLYNGVSGLMPPQREKDIHAHLKEFPSNISIDLLKTAKIELLLVEYDQYQQMYDANFQLGDIKIKDPKLIKSELEKRTDTQLLDCQENKCLYKALR